MPNRDPFITDVGVRSHSGASPGRSARFSRATASGNGTPPRAPTKSWPAGTNSRHSAASMAFPPIRSTNYQEALMARACCPYCLAQRTPLPQALGRATRCQCGARSSDSPARRPLRLECPATTTIPTNAGAAPC